MVKWLNKPHDFESLYFEKTSYAIKMFVEVIIDLKLIDFKR